MRVRKQYRSALGRQVGEAVSIHEALKGGYVLMNSKSKYNRCQLPRLSMNNKKALEEMKREEELENKKKAEIRNMKSKRKRDGKRKGETLNSLF